MPTIDIGKLLAPLSADSPCGDDLEYDAEFIAMERSAQWTPEVEMGSFRKPAEPPNWRNLFDNALALFGRTKDLRAAVHLVNAGCRLDGLPALASGLALVKGLLVDYWDSVHPMLDETDGNDPTLRMNSLLPLGTRDGVVEALLNCPLARSRRIGKVTLRDVRIAAGQLPPPKDGEVLEQAHIEAAFADAELEELEASADAARRALEDLNAILGHIAERVRPTEVPDLGLLVADLTEVHKVLSAQLARRGADGADAAAAPAVSAGGNGAAEALPGRTFAVGEITSREDAVKALDKICEYFQRNEPSSPVPLLLRRAQRLVAKDFLEILRDLTPDGVSQAKLIGGLDQDN